MKNQFHRFFTHYLPVIAWAILIYSLSTTSDLKVPEFNLLQVDKVGHLVFYGILTLLLLRAILPREDDSSTVILLLAFFIAGAYGVSLEYVQATLPGRCFDYADMVANFIGCGVALVFYKIYWSRFSISK